MTRYRPFILVLLCALGWQAAWAQYRFDSWTTDDGLPQNGVRTIAQTPDGYLWFTTLDGLVRFDGVKFTIFNKGNSDGIINNRFWVMRAFADGSVWATTEAGDLTIYRDGVFKSYPAAQVPDEKIHNFFWDTDNEVLIETNLNHYKLRGEEFILIKKIEQNTIEKTIYESKAGDRWEIFNDHTLQIKDGSTSNYNVQVPPFVSYFEDKSGGLWLGGVKLAHLKDGKITEYTEADGYPPGVLPHRFWEEQDGSLWFATGGYDARGVGLVRMLDGKFARFGLKEGLSNDRIFDVFKDGEGTIWVATDMGLNRLRRQTITTLSTADGLVNKEVYPIMRARDGSVYVGTVGGLMLYADGKFSRVDLGSSEKYVVNVQSLYEDESGRVWVGIVGGLFVIDNGRTRNLTAMFGIPQRTISAIHCDREGSMWFGTDEGGVYKYRDDKISANYRTEQGLAGNDVKAIHESDDGTLWFGTYSGLSKFKDGEFTNYTTTEGLPSNFVRSIKEDTDGTFWIGTYDGGLSRFKDGRFFNFSTANGLFNNGVFAIQEDKAGNFWMSSNKESTVLTDSKLADFAEGKISRYDSVAYGKDDGMLSAECNGGRQPAAITDGDGRIWFPTLEGIAVVDPNVSETNTLPPNVVIENIAVDRNGVSLSGLTQVEIGPSQNYLDITYTALSLIKSDQIPFRYKLEGLDQDWIDAGTRRTVNYSYLPPGDYTFRVIAANTDGVWNEKGRSVKVVVIAPFYKTWRFLAAVVIMFAVLGYLLYRYRIAQFRKLSDAQEAFSRQLIESQEAERKRIAREIHDGLGQNLLVIKNRAKLGQLTSGKEETDEQFAEIQDSVTEALSEVRTIAYNLRPLHLERLGLTSTIEEMIEEIELVSQIKIEQRIESIDNLFLSENEINFYRIVQECLNNIVKHSGAAKAVVTIVRRDQNVQLMVEDDGSGFDLSVAKEKHGMGLSGMAERVKMIGGHHSIISDSNGTKVSVDVRAEKSINE